MDKDTAEARLRSLREVSAISKDADFALVDEIEAAQHLLRACIMACESIEAMDERNALVALIAEVERRIVTCTDYLRSVHGGR